MYGIATLPDKVANKAHDAYYEKRNAIVHGREGIPMTLSEYQIAETHVIEAVLHLITECGEKYRLHV